MMFLIDIDQIKHCGQRQLDKYEWTSFPSLSIQLDFGERDCFVWKYKKNIKVQCQKVFHIIFFIEKGIFLGEQSEEKWRMIRSISMKSACLPVPLLYNKHLFTLIKPHNYANFYVP